MIRERTKESFTLRVLALVLALALLWYSLNPVPRTAVGRRTEAQPPEEKKRKVEARTMAATLPIAFGARAEVAQAVPAADEDEDDFQWPEYIDG